MIDRPEQATALLARLEGCLPIRTRLSPPALATLDDDVQRKAADSPCEVTEVVYSGDYGGIMCRLDFGEPDATSAYVVSLTQLVFERSLPLWREIDAYRRHRLKKIRRQNGFEQ